MILSLALIRPTFSQRSLVLSTFWFYRSIYVAEEICFDNSDINEIRFIDLPRISGRNCIDNRDSCHATLKKMMIEYGFIIALPNESDSLVAT